MSDGKQDINCILNCLSEGVLIVDDDLQVFDNNQSALDLLGITLEDFLITKIDDIIKDDKFRNALKQLKQANTIQQNLQIFVNGRAIGCKMEMYNNKDSGNRYIIVLEDISRYQQMDKIKQEFINVLLHRLRNPLTSIKTAISILNSGKIGLTEQAKEIVDLCYNEVNRLHNFLNDLRHIFFIEIGLSKSGMVIESVTLSRVLERAIKEVSKTLEQDVSKIISISGDSQETVHGDFEKLKSIFFHLLKNAVVYSANEKEVAVQVQTEDNSVSIRITDYGIGMNQEESSNIYDKYYRADNPANRQLDGNGVGLFITQSFVKDMNGTIFCESEPGKGTTFTVNLSKGKK